MTSDWFLSSAYLSAVASLAYESLRKSQNYVGTSMASPSVAGLGARLLATTDPHEAAALAERLDALNTERRDIETAVAEVIRAS